MYLIPWQSLTRLVCAGILAALSACAHPTPYQAMDDGHGYAAQALEDDRYRVTFAGNSLTPRDTVENYLLYRAAQITLERGHDYFIVVRKDVERSTRYHSTVAGLGGHHGLHGFHGFGHRRPHGVGFGATVSARPQTRYSAHADIVMRRGETPDDDLRAHDARQVIENLQPAVETPAES